MSSTLLRLICGTILFVSALPIGCGAGREVLSDVTERTPLTPSADNLPLGTPKRIVSLAPNITETLFALGLGDRVVGVSRFCDYPAEVKSIAQVGGFLDPSYEAIVGLEPDLVVLLTSHRDARRELEKMKLRVLVTPEETIAGIWESVRLIGETCGVPDEADRLLTQLTERTHAVEAATAGLSRPRVLVCIGRDMDTGTIASVYAAGKKTFYDEIIDAAGGINVLGDPSVPYPQLSAEGVIELNPDVIVDLINMIPPGGKTPDEIAHQWKTLPRVNAVTTGRVHVIVGSHALRPGPRYVQFLEEIARLLHPEAFEKERS